MVNIYLVGGLEYFLNFPINIGLHSSSQLTNSYFSEGWPKTTNQELSVPRTLMTLMTKHCLIRQSVACPSSHGHIWSCSFFLPADHRIFLYIFCHRVCIIYIWYHMMISYIYVKNKNPLVNLMILSWIMAVDSWCIPFPEKATDRGRRKILILDVSLHFLLSRFFWGCVPEVQSSWLWFLFRIMFNIPMVHAWEHQLPFVEAQSKLVSGDIKILKRLGSELAAAEVRKREVGNHITPINVGSMGLIVIVCHGYSEMVIM